MDVQQWATGARDALTRTDPAPPEDPPPATGAPPEGSPSSQPEPAAGSGLAEAETLNRLAKIVLALIPALTVALAAIGGATGGLARLFRDQTFAAQGSIALVILAVLLAGLARRPTDQSLPARRLARRLRVRAALLMASGIALVVGIAWAFDAQIAVMGEGQAPVVTGALTPTASGDSLDAHVQASGVPSSRRIVVFAYESSDQNGEAGSRTVTLYSSKTGPNADGQVDVHVVAQIPGADLQQFPYVFVTAVLGEDQRDCDGVLVDKTLKRDDRPEDTACLTLERPGAPVPSAAAASSSASSSSSSASSASPFPTAALATPVDADVPGTVAWTDTGVSLTRGQRFIVHATGQVSFIQGGPLVGPDGDDQPHPGVCVLPGPDHHAGLIGRISAAGTPFLVGSSYDGIADRSGRLALGINDVGVDNNGGAFAARIQVAER